MVDGTSLGRAPAPPTPRAPLDDRIAAPAGAPLARGGCYEIPISRGVRPHGDGRRWWWAAGVVVLAGCLLAAFGGIAWQWRPAPHERATVVEIRPAVPPAGGFAQPPDRMGDALEGLLPPAVRAQVSSSFGGTYVEAGTGGVLPRRVQVGTVLLRSGARVRVEVRRASTPCTAAPCVDRGPRRARTVNAAGVEVLVVLDLASSGVVLEPAQLGTIAAARVWTG